MAAEYLVLNPQIPRELVRLEQLLFTLAMAGLVFSSAAPELRAVMTVLLLLVHARSLRLRRRHAAVNPILIPVSAGLSSPWRSRWACLLAYRDSPGETRRMALVFASSNAPDTWRRLQVLLRTRAGQAQEPPILC